MVWWTGPTVNALRILDSFVGEQRSEVGVCERWVRVHSLLMLVVVSAAAWLGAPRVVAAYAAGAFGVLIVQMRGRWVPKGLFGVANTLTTARLLATLALCALHERIGGFMVAAVALTLCAVDIVDGWVARRTKTESAFGATYDVEVDTLLVVTLLFLLVERGHVGAWVLFVCYWHYVYFLAPVLFPTPVGAAPRSLFGRTIYTVMMLSFIAGFFVPPAWASPLAGLGAGVVSVSFLISFWQRYSPSPIWTPGDEGGDRRR